MPGSPVGAAPAAPPTFAALIVRPTPIGFEIAPRGPGADLWIEAIVWAVGAVGMALALVLGGPALRVVGAIGLVAIGVRALVRVARALLGKTTRTVRLMLRVPRPALAGMLESVPLDQVTQLAVGRRANLTGLIATTPTGKEHWLVDLDPANAAEYQQLAAWLATFVPRR